MSHSYISSFEHNFSWLRALIAMLLCTLLAAFVAFPVLPAQATPAEDAQAEADAALVELNAMQEKLDAASNDYFEALAAQEEAQAKVDDAQARIEEASVRISELQDQLSIRARSMYRNGSLTMIDLVLGATTFEEFATTWDLLNQMNENDAEMTKEAKELRAEVEEQKVILSEQEAVCEQKTAEAKAVQEEAEALVATMQETYDSLSEEAAELLEEEREAQRAAEAAAAQAAIEQAAQDNSGTSNSDDSSSGVEPEYNAETGNAVVDRALSYVGNGSYVWGACSPGSFDCSGFVSYCLTGEYSRLGTTYTFLEWQQVTDPQPGDICVNSGHCGIYYGNGQMIHCASPSEGIIIGGVQSGMIYVRY